MAPSSSALRSLLRLQVVKKSLVAETQCLCVETDSEANRGAVISTLCLLLQSSLLTHTAGGQSGPGAPVPGPSPRSPAVSPGSPPQTQHHSLPRILLHSGFSHSAPSLSLESHTGHHSALHAQCLMRPLQAEIRY